LEKKITTTGGPPRAATADEENPMALRPAAASRDAVPPPQPFGARRVGEPTRGNRHFASAGKLHAYANVTSFVRFAARGIDRSVV
jgi:hypothetical protein